MGEAKRYLILSFLIFFLSISPSSPATFPDDFSTMQKLANLLTPTPQGWLSSTDPCGNTKWSGVVCSSGRVVSINIASQSISGTLPSDLNKLAALKSLSLQKNTLSGSLPSLANLINLQEIYLDGNQFSSIPPTFFDNLPSLQSVSLDGNPLLPWSIPDLSQSTSLAMFYASNSNVVGPIPDFFGSLPSLQSLRLSYNNITGGLPHTFATSGLKNLWLNNQKSTTKLEGPIDVLGSMTQLSQVWLQTNSFTGPVPDLSNCTSLFDLQLRDNRLTGVLPQSIFTLPSLLNVSLGNNNLQGPFPSFASAVKVDNAITNNNFCNANGGPCDPRVTMLLLVAAGFGYPETLSDSWTGDDPCSGWSFVSCDPQGNVIVLSLAKQNLVGSISPAIANLTSLKTLILSNNNLTGPIPNGLAGLSQLQTVDLSNNNLIGKVPVFNPSVKLNTTGNPLLGSNSTGGGGGASSGGSGSSASSPDGSPGGKSTSSFSVGLIVGIVLGVLLIIGLLIFICWKRSKSRQGKSFLNGPETMKLTATGMNGNGVVTSELNSLSSSGHSNANVFAIGSMVISINDLRLATNNFSEDNIVGKGGFGVVYKGVLHDGSQVAVKRMESSVISSKGTSEFQAEIAVLTKVRHRHLVGLKGYCTDGNEKLLVYEYMPQGTLGQHLFEGENHGYEILSWKQRLTIALDVARGIEYLHSLAHQSFIHRDLKPSNILLGDDMRAKVSDFGLVKLAPDGKYSMETRLAGTFGYLAPEYAATGKVTTKADIYSFGVVLMEMITGRKVLDDAQPEEKVNLVTWFRRVLISKADMKIKDIVDPTIKPDEDKDEDKETFSSILNVAELAGHCTARDPTQRPEMGNVVNILSPMVEQWKPASPDDEDGYDADGHEEPLADRLMRWRANEGTSAMGASMIGGGGPYTHMTSLGSTQSSIVMDADGIPRTFKSKDAR
ncbi:receptor-like kinase TMK4 [Magnolia sinica]|uniref:receptor-like kinase TMK4 n=1 Tax=Magnolia sinica TaxID=86752 RepID=UPI00265AA6EE|nr:receptor-like kinase TMK4 [Magnolia sinica]